MSKRSSPSFLIVALMSCISIDTSAQEEPDTRSTGELSFLVGQWQITRTYNPGTEEPRVLKGTLTCAMAMDDQFVRCTYEMERPGRIRGLDEVYFNYNPIYETYESLWLSSTWPVKVLMQGDLIKTDEGQRLNTKAQFLIQDGITEYVKDELVLSESDAADMSFFRQTFIRTNNDAEDDWYHHMNESAVRILE